MGSQEFSNAPSNAEGRGAIEGPGMEEEPLMPRVNVESVVYFQFLRFHLGMLSGNALWAPHLLLQEEQQPVRARRGA